MTNDVLSELTEASVEGTFLANRSRGRVELIARKVEDETRRERVGESGCLRVRFPAAEGPDLQAVIVNTAGGIAGGDHHQLDIVVRKDARLIITSAAAEKAYRSLATDASIDVRLRVEAGGRLCWLPQETILFDGGRLSRRFEVELAPDAALTMAEMTVFGRSAMGESVDHGSFADRWRVRRGGRLLFAEGLRLDGAVAERLAEPGVAAGGVAIATVLVVPGDDAIVARVRTLNESFSSEVGISAWNGIAVARLCARDGASLREDLLAVLTALRAPLPRLWLN
jgi:urease accessory protein